MNVGTRTRPPGAAEPEPGQESAWDYPRPPRLEPTRERLRVVVDGVALADTTRGVRVLETSHPPVYYVPAADVRLDLLVANARTYVDLVLPPGTGSSRLARRVANFGWRFAAPARGFEAIRGHLAFYASRADEAWVDDELVIPQAGDFYGGWITSRVVGPFKGGAGTFGW
jgi:uncharacterized protein (DUF427 family)